MLSMKQALSKRDLSELIDLCTSNNKILIPDINLGGFPLVYSLFDDATDNEIDFLLNHFNDSDESNIFINQYGTKINILYYALKMNNLELGKIIIQKEPDLVYKVCAFSSRGWSYPFMYMAVILENYDFIDYILKNKYYDINYIFYLNSEEKNNLLVAAKSKNIRDYLINNGINIGYPFIGEYTCTDDRVRIRELPFIDSDVVGYCSNNTNVRVIQKTYFSEWLSDGYGCWYEIETEDGLNGWSFSCYFKKQ